jgi:hypothetical protein
MVKPKKTLLYIEHFLPFFSRVYLTEKTHTIYKNYIKKFISKAITYDEPTPQPSNHHHRRPLNT